MILILISIIHKIVYIHIYIYIHTYVFLYLYMYKYIIPLRSLGGRPRAGIRPPLPDAYLFSNHPSQSTRGGVNRNNKHLTE